MLRIELEFIEGLERCYEYEITREFTRVYSRFREMLRIELEFNQGLER